MHYAARGGHMAVLETLLEAGGDVDAMDKDARGSIFYAARRGHTEVCSWLLRSGSGQQRQDVHGLSPLHQAVLARSGECVAMLLAALGAGNIPISAASAGAFSSAGDAGPAQRFALVSSAGAGLLVSTAVSVVVPEAFHALMAIELAGNHDAHGHDGHGHQTTNELACIFVVHEMSPTYF